MGKQSRRKRERREDPRRIGEAAEARGRKVGSELAAYRNVVSDRGHVGLKEALVSRHNRRWEQVSFPPPELRASAMAMCASLPQADLALSTLRGRKIPSTLGHEEDWLDELSRSLDSIAASTRLMLCGQLIGATALLRHQLERWSMNVATNRGLTKAATETDAEFFRRVWAGHPAFSDSAAVWCTLSETLHGRGPWLNAVVTETVGLVDRPVGIAETTVVRAILPAMGAALFQIRVCLGTALDEVGETMFGARIRSGPLMVVGQRPSLTPLTLWPLDLGHVESPGAAVLLAAEQDYADEIERLRESAPASTHHQLLDLAFVARRARALRHAQHAFSEERKQLGSGFRPEGLGEKQAALILACELAGLLSHWAPGPGATALAVAASALRSAWQLWLEDDDRALILVRAALEATAVARTWRAKPGQAVRLTERGDAASPRDWFEAAGWRRLSAVNRSLGEFAHFSYRARWSGARRVLTAAQRADPDSPSPPEQTARGHALGFAVVALMLESVAWTHRLAPEVAAAYARLTGVPADGSNPRGLDGWLNHVWELRAADFGDPDFARITDAVEVGQPEGASDPGS